MLYINRLYILIVAIISMIFCNLPSLISQDNDINSNNWVVIKSDKSELILKYTTNIHSFDNIYLNDTDKVFLPIIKEAYANKNINDDIVSLISSKNITIPAPDGYSIESITISGFEYFSCSEILNYKNISSTEVSEILKKSFIPFTPDFNVNDWIILNYKGIARDKYIARITAIAALYNPYTNSIYVPKEIIIKIKLDASKATCTAINSKDAGLPISLNYNDTKEWTINPETNKALKSKNQKNKLLSSSSENYVRIAIQDEGVYRITADMLSSIGVNIPSGKAGTIKIYSNGGRELSQTVSDGANNQMNEQSIIVRTNGDNLESIIFYGAPGYGFTYTKGDGFRHYINHYSGITINTGVERNNEQNYYILTWDGDNGTRATAKEPPASDASLFPLVYTQGVFFEEELYNPYPSPSGREWFGSTIFPRTFINSLPDIDRTCDMFYRIGLASASSTSGHFTITESGKTLCGLYLSGITGDNYANSGEKTAKLPASNIPTNNESNLKLSWTIDGSGSSTPYFNWYELYFNRQFIPQNNELGFFSDTATTGIAQYSINNYSGEIFGFQVTDPSKPQLIKNISTTGNMFVFKDSVIAYNPNRYFISSNLKSPLGMEKTTFANLRTKFGNSDVILITHNDLVSSAENFKKYREANSDLTVNIVTTSQIFNEFGSGLSDITAIRDFISFAVNNWDKKPKYVILWGDGHYDYKGLSTNIVNFVPPWESLEKTYFNDNSYTMDDYYVCAVGDDDIIDLSIGRVTINSNDEGNAIVDKIKHYEHSSSNDNWRSVVTLMADDSYSGATTVNNHSVTQWEGTQHTSSSERISTGYISKDFIQRKIYLPDYPAENIPGGIRKPAATQDMVTQINTTGTLLLNWIGHGNPRVLAHEELFNRDKTISLMSNYDKLFFFITATCEFGRFDLGSIKSGAEELFLSTNGGAIGLLTTSRKVSGGGNESLEDVFFPALFKRDSYHKYPRLGDAYLLTKMSCYDYNSQCFYLLGDPTMRLNFPEDIAAVDSINGIYIGYNSDTTIQLDGLSKAKVSGRILSSDSSSVVTGFNGTAIVNFFDCDFMDTPIDIDPNATVHHILKNGATLNRSICEVKNGVFSTEFVIPKDISFCCNNGKLYVFAYSKDSVYAKGMDSNYKICSIDTNLANDNTPPEIKIYLDSRNFVSGQYVNPTPLLIVDLFDDTGLNTTGIGIGHKIDAWIDDSPYSIDLTSKFANSLTDPRAGSIEMYLSDLEAGTHKIKIRAWDVFNNFATAETYFLIAPGNAVILTNLINYPNPFYEKTGTTFSFNHNIYPPFDVELDIFSSVGMHIVTVKNTISTYHTGEVYWNGLNYDGVGISAGAYFYRIKAITNDGINNSSTSSFIYINK